MPTSPRLLSISTAVPANILRQEEIKHWANRFFGGGKGPDLSRLLPAFDNAGIATRYSCVPLDWYDRTHGWQEKNRLYLSAATDLIQRAATDCLARAGMAAGDVDAIVMVSTSGIATPTLDARLMQRLPFRTDVMRLPIFGLGCAGGTLGFARAAELARDGRHVLFLVVELCGLTFRYGDRSKANVIATALFGDGAAAVLLGPGTGPAVTAWGEHTWPDTLSVMGWTVEEDGLGVVFSQDIPTLVRREMRSATERYLAKSGQTLADIDTFVCHPGGTKVIEALEEVFGAAPGSLRHSREILRDYGNMSAATVLFVLERMLADGVKGRLLLSALGPGFTAGFVTVEAG
jgi:alkylresorcinol/alkylpyrone synthase